MYRRMARNVQFSFAILQCKTTSLKLDCFYGPFFLDVKFNVQNDKFIVLMDASTRGVQNIFFCKVVPEGLLWEAMGQNDKFNVFTIKNSLVSWDARVLNFKSQVI